MELHGENLFPDTNWPNHEPMFQLILEYVTPSAINMARVAHPYLLGNTFHPSVLVTRFLPQAQKSQRADSRKVSKAQYSVSSGKPFVQYLHNPAKPQQQAEVTRHRVKGTTPEDVFRFPDDDEERPNNRRGTDDRQKQSSGILSYQTNCKCIYLLWYFGDLSVTPLRQSYSIGTPLYKQNKYNEPCYNFFKKKEM